MRDDEAAPALRIAVAGAGLIGRRHIDLVMADPGCTISAIIDPTAHTAALADALRVRRFASLTEAFRHDSPDGVVIAAPTRLHVPLGLECVQAGVPALVEKPIADTVRGAEALVQAAESAGVPVLAGHHRRHSPVLGAARDVVRSGQLGRIVAVTGSCLVYKPDDYFEAGPWRREPGGGPILINLIHDIDGLRYLCGDIDSVQATASHRVRGFPVEDTVATTLRFTNGALGTFMLSDVAVSAHNWEQTSQEDPRYPTYPDEDCYLIAGTQGSLSIPTMRLRRHVGASSWWKPTHDPVVTVDRSDPLVAQLRHFCAVVRGTATPLVSAAEATESLRVTLAIAEAASLERSVPVGLPDGATPPQTTDEATW